MRATQMKLEVKIQDFGLHIDDAEKLEEIETKVHKELQHDKLIFFLEDINDLLQMNIDIAKIQRKVDGFKKAFEQELLDHEEERISQGLELNEWRRNRQ